MATVYLAEDLKHHRKVAVKVMRPEFAATLGATRFLREIEMAAGLTHPHILPVHDSGETGGFLYYVMPYADGESLRRRLLRERRLPPEDALQIVREVANALDYAHRQGLVHRDIKPENILLPEGNAVVADFGIARAITAAGGDTLTQAGMAVGTPLYMSPEQAIGIGTLDGRADIYSLGRVCYEMLVGELPEQWLEQPAVSRGRFTEASTEHRRQLDALPEKVERVLVTALALQPGDRFATAAEFARALGSPPGAWRTRSPLDRCIPWLSVGCDETDIRD